MSHTQTQLKGYAAMLLAMVTWASAVVVIRIGLKGYHPGSLALLRYLTASIAILPVYIKIKKPAWRVTVKDIFLIVVSSMLGIGLYNIALNYGEITVQAATANFVIAQVPVLSTVIAILFLGDPNTLQTWLGILVSFLGILLIAFSHGHLEISHGLLLILLATVFAALYVTMQKPVLGKVGGLRYACYAIWVGSIILIYYAPQLKLDLRHAPLTGTLSGIYLGIVPGAIGYALFSYALSNLSTTKAVSIMYAAPAMTLFLGWIMLGEVPAGLSIASGALALVGAFVVNRRRKP